MATSLWRRITGTVPEIEMEVEFGLDLDADGRHVVSLFERTDGMRKRIEAPESFWNYGTTFVRNGQRYRVALKDVEILQGLRSLNPELRSDGALVLDFLPPILVHLRKRPHTSEEVASAAIGVSEEPLSVRATVDYAPDAGVTITAGYGCRDSHEVIPRGALKVTRDGGYAQVGDVYHPLEKLASTAGSRWLEAGIVRVPLGGVPEFFVRDLVLLMTELSAVLTDQAAQVRVINAPTKPRVTVQRNEPGWLDFVVDYQVGTYTLPQEVALSGASKRDRYVQADSYTFVPVDSGVIEQTEAELEKLNAVATPSGYRIAVTRFASLEEFIDHIGGVRALSEEYARFLSQLLGFELDETFRLSERAEANLKNAGINLRPYQRAGIQWLNWLRENHLHGILADDMGLGKTVQAICALNIAHERQEVDRPSLIVCPKSVVPFWVREVRRCVPDIRICSYAGPGRDRRVWSHAGKNWYVTTYETLARDIDVISRTPFYFAILDEASKIKNPDAQRTQAIKSINAMHRLALSGTPVENRLSEMWSIFDFLIKGLFGSRSAFESRYETPILEGDRDAAQHLARRIRPFLLRRLKEDVAKDLPEKIEIEDWCELTEEQRALYGQIQDGLAKPLRDEIAAGVLPNYQMNILPILTKLKQVCDHPALITGDHDDIWGRSEKFDATADSIREILGDGERVVLFSHFLGTLDLFERALRERQTRYIRIDGSTSNRQKLIDDFNAGRADVALCSIQACGYGITLTAANHVIHFDRWWNPAVEDQATDRVHRIGQSKTVYVHRTLTAGTLEEKIALMLDRKRALADRVVGAAVGQAMQWTREELLELLRPLE
jgi:superfamily II DNA or RNA helicase